MCAGLVSVDEGTTRNCDVSGAHRRPVFVTSAQWRSINFPKVSKPFFGISGSDFIPRVPRVGREYGSRLLPIETWHSVSRPFLSMPMRRLTSSLALVLVVGNHLAAQSQKSSDLWAGTRHLVLSKSTFRGGPAPKERTFVIETVNGGIRATVTGTETDGTPLNFCYTAKFDGKYYPISDSAGRDSVSFRRVSARRLQSTAKTDGKAA